MAKQCGPTFKPLIHDGHRQVLLCHFAPHTPLSPPFSSLLHASYTPPTRLSHASHTPLTHFCLQKSRWHCFFVHRATRTFKPLARALSLSTHTLDWHTLLLLSCIPLQLWQKEGRDEFGFRVLPWESTSKVDRERHTARGLCFTSNATLFGGAVDVERHVEREARERAQGPLKKAEVCQTASQLLIVSSHMHARSGK